MSRRLNAIARAGVGAGLLAFAAGLSAAQAADLPYEERYGSAYEDPRYADMYGREPARPKTYTYRYDAPPPPPPADYGFRSPPIPRAPVYGHENYKDYGYREPEFRPRHVEKSRCTPKDEVRYDLERRGWHDFHDAQVIDRETGALKARRPSGRLFVLHVDRCSGEIVSQRPLGPAPEGPYAYREPRGYRY